MVAVQDKPDIRQIYSVLQYLSGLSFVLDWDKARMSLSNSCPGELLGEYRLLFQSSGNTSVFQHIQWSCSTLYVTRVLALLAWALMTICAKM